MKSTVPESTHFQNIDMHVSSNKRNVYWGTLFV